jgi:phospholipid-transporting ATPase
VSPSSPRVFQVGVGISGREGLQAVNSSDFAIAQFRFLAPLLLVHGRWSYRRMAKVFLYSFFKNVVITFTLFYFNVFTGWSGASLYESLVYSGFNFFLGLPIIGIGIFDRWVAVCGRGVCGGGGAGGSNPWMFLCMG